MRLPMQKLLIPTLLGLAIFAGSVNAAAPLRPPQGYFAHTAGHQHLLETTASTNDQNDRRRPP